MKSSSTSIFMRKAVAGQVTEKLFEESENPAKNQDLQKAKKDFLTHFACTQSWYMRISSFHKLKFMKQLFIRLKSTNSLGLILNALLIWSSKATYYSMIQHNTNFAYDKMLLDNNRSINLKHMKKIKKLELELFESLTESEQTLIIVGLIRRSGGQFVHELFQFGERLQNQLTSQKHLLIEDEQFKTLLENRPKINESEFNLRNTQSIPNLITSIPISNAIHCISSTPDNIKKVTASVTTQVKYHEEEDPANPFVMEVAKRKKVWDTTITSYRIQVEGKPKKPQKEGKGKKGKNKKDKKGKDKKEKKGKDKKKKKEKKGKKGKKGKKKGELENIDLIQMLPYWTVLKIFSYLDAKTLKKIKAVNKYWEFAANELKKCLKARKAIDKLIGQMAASVGEVEEVEEIYKIYKPVDEGQLPKKRLLELSERGAAIKKLQKSKYHKQTTTCLLSDALKQMHEYYIIPVRYMEIFPRDMNLRLADNVPKIPSCIINELGFSKIDKSDFTSCASFSFDEICNFDNQYEIPSDRQNYFENMSAFTFDMKY